MAAINEQRLQHAVVKVSNRWPSAGLAVAVVRDGSLAWFKGQGVSDVVSATPVTEDTVFRIGSITKTFTAIAVLQLWEQGLVDLDAPASDYLHAFRLTPARGVSPPTLRQLLTHTAGIGYWRRLSDLRRPGFGAGDSTRDTAPSLAEYYRDGLPVEVKPGTKWVYSNHGFATLGQIVEEVSGEPIERYLRDHVLDVLGMDDTTLARTQPARAAWATGYALRSGGLRAVTFRDVPLVAAGGAYSTARDLARYVGALLSGGTGERGVVLKPETLAVMFQPHHQPDRRLPGMGLGFLLGNEDGHRTAGHDGILSGFLSAISLAPDDGLGVVVLGNTGWLDGRGAPQQLAGSLTRLLLDLPDSAIRDDVPQQPQLWGDLCGWYGMDSGPVTNLFNRLLMGAGVEVRVRGDHLMLQPLTPLPPLRDGFRLYPDDPDDPSVFRVDFSAAGMGTLRVVFSGVGAGQPLRLLLDGMSFEKRPAAGNPRRWLSALLAGGTAGLAVVGRGPSRRRVAAAA
jgi:CubicO group peptidase (beta-lactamase class C family)